MPTRREEYSVDLTALAFLLVIARHEQQHPQHHGLRCDAVMRRRCRCSNHRSYLSGRKQQLSHSHILLPLSCQCVRLHLNLHALPTDLLPPHQHFNQQQPTYHPVTKAFPLPETKSECLPPPTPASSSSRALSTPPLASSSPASRRPSCLQSWISSLAGPRLPSSSFGRTMLSSVTPLLSQRAGRSSSLNGYVDSALQQSGSPASNTPSQYGLQTAFSEIERKSHSVTSSGNPIEMDMTTMYKVKGIGKETTINSKINIFHDNGKITRVEDKWDGSLPDSSIANVSNHYGLNAVNPFFWMDYAFSWFFMFWVFCYDAQYTRKIGMVRGCVVFSSNFIASSYLTIYLIYPLLCTHTDKHSLGIPPPQRRQRPQDGRCAQERRGGRQTWQLGVQLHLHQISTSHNLVQQVQLYWSGTGFRLGRRGSLGTEDHQKHSQKPWSSGRCI
jgi:hypothetical protein